MILLLSLAKSSCESTPVSKITPFQVLAFISQSVASSGTCITRGILEVYMHACIDTCIHTTCMQTDRHTCARRRDNYSSCWCNNVHLLVLFLHQDGSSDLHHHHVPQTEVASQGFLISTIKCKIYMFICTQNGHTNIQETSRTSTVLLCFDH